MTRVLLGAACLATGLFSTLDPASTGAAPDASRPMIGDLEYEGAFRLSSADFGVSNTNYAVGALAYNPAHHSLFIAGHAQHNAIAEFDIPAELGTGDVVADLPVVESPRQEFAAPLERAPTGNPDGIDRINGMYVDGDDLILNAERWYDAAGTATDTTLVLDAADIAGSVDGYFRLEGRAHAGGYLSPVPSEWQERLGGDLVTGWAANTSIISRHSVGPTLFALTANDLLDGDATVDPSISTMMHLDYPFDGGHYLADDALDTSTDGASPLWNFLAKARYGFIIPGTSTFMVLGEIGGVDSGIGYKIRQDDGTLCGGYCSYRADDQHNAYWLYDLDEVLAADEVYEPRPYTYGTWTVPFDDDGAHSIIGGTFDPASSQLYLALGNAGQVGDYDRPPLIVVYAVPDLVDGPDRILHPARATDRAVRLAQS